ncbi:copper chaperone [Rubrobacter taiwanensis]|jgi:copper chaperone|uniref:Copper chaperone n=1 Tax=Rubrobacter taiwanensis TaxID=185139 RepID=A0A4R1BQL6_9ACTN|nr:copper ion binding protein [Rubrobacter taiwanensis]TCJ20039.1 copper chaperone [Rubrobacter taiwanensis]
MKRIRLTVPDMSCAHCKAAIEESLGRLPGVERAGADPDTKQVEVAFDEGRANEEQIRLAIENAGYSVAA